MRVGINLLYLLPGVVGGTETYAVSLIRAMTSLNADHEYFVFLNEESRDLDLGPAASINRVVMPVRARHRPTRYYWEQFHLPAWARRAKVDVLHSAGYVGPVFAPCAHVVTVHDLNFLAIGNAMTPLRRAVLSTMVRLSVRSSEEIITPSEFSRREVITHLGTSPDRVTVTPEAPKEWPRVSKTETSGAVLAKFGIKRPYIVAFSSLSPHKNIPRLVEAFASLGGDFPHKLALIGHLPPESDIAGQIKRKGLAERVIATGYLGDLDLAPLLRAADVFVLPSLYEGFGLPVLDAQRLSVPVACSTAGSLPEVAGDGAAYFSPRSVDEMASVLRSLLRDPASRQELVRRGQENVKKYSWEKTATATLAVYARAYSRNKATKFHRHGRLR